MINCNNYLGHVMKIVTWNLRRPNYNSEDRNTKIISALKEVKADILILTETNSIINPGTEYTSKATNSLPGAGNICIAGDFNISFSDNFYYTKEGRQKITSSFEELQIANLTQSIPQNMDHIAISKSFLKSMKCTEQIWIDDKRLSDHIGVSIMLDR